MTFAAYSIEGGDFLRMRVVPFCRSAPGDMQRSLHAPEWALSAQVVA
jgi:hypothetical protein